MFDIDIEHCPHCGGTLKIIAAIEDPAVIAKILLADVFVFHGYEVEAASDG